MNRYKVHFQDNKATSATIIDGTDEQGAIKLSREKGVHKVEWFIVYSDTEKNAIELAASVVERTWGSMLNGG